jgi:hypothetical protein
VTSGIEVRVCLSGSTALRTRLVADLEEAHAVAARWRDEIVATGGVGST